MERLRRSAFTLTKATVNIQEKKKAAGITTPQTIARSLTVKTKPVKTDTPNNVNSKKIVDFKPGVHTVTKNKNII